LVLAGLARLNWAESIAKITDTDPDDMVTIADREVEAYLAERLTALLPGAAVVGEESVYGSPGSWTRSVPRQCFCYARPAVPSSTRAESSIQFVRHIN
jgi:3'-phosphoadenosine 5'-phosphosulfate (PAPS) 3'-phosphatase